MKLFAVCMIGAVVPLLVGCHRDTEAPDAPSAKDPPLVSVAARDVLSPSDLERQRSLAESGDQAALAKLEWHYSRVGDQKSYEFWLERGASLGNPASMQRYAQHLASQGGTSNCQRAIELLDDARARMSGEDNALRKTIDTDLRVLKGEVQGVPGCR